MLPVQLTEGLAAETSPDSGSAATAEGAAASVAAAAASMMRRRMEEESLSGADRDAVAAQIRAGMVAFCAGDALGVPWEGRPPAEIAGADLDAFDWSREDWPRGST